MNRKTCSLVLLSAVALPLVMALDTEPAALRIDVDASRVTGIMRGGIGASWHAIEGPIHGPAGSAWGANPPPEDAAAWREVFRHANWLGLDWCRVELEQRTYEPERAQFDWSSRDMRVLKRILDWCQQNRVDVFLQQMWGNVGWNTFPEWREDPARRVRSGPLSLDDFAEGLAMLVQHLVKEKRYTCIRWLSINNEPAGWWLRPPNQPMPLTPALAAVRNALDRKGLFLPLSGPDWSDLPPLEPEKIDFDQFIGAYDLHCYQANFDGSTGGYPMTLAVQRLREWADWAHARGKPFSLSELGTMAFGWQDSHPGPGTYESAIKDAEMIIRGISAGVDGFNRWSFINRGDLDGQWQLLDTWDMKEKRLLKHCIPHPNAYFVIGLLSRFTAKHSSVLACKVAADNAGPRQHLFAAALRSPGGQLTVAVVNDANLAWEGTVTVQGLKKAIRLRRYAMTPGQRDRSKVEIKSERTFKLASNAPVFADHFPAMSLTVYSTYDLAPGDAGIIAE